MKVYLAGPINGCTDEEAYGWRADAKLRFTNGGVESIDPLDRDFRGREQLNYRDIVENDLKAIRVSDVVLANLWKKNQPYFGTAMEIMYANMIGVAVVSVMPDSGITVKGAKLQAEIEASGAHFHPWIQYHSRLVVNKLDDAIEHIIECNKHGLRV